MKRPNRRRRPLPTRSIAFVGALVITAAALWVAQAGRQHEPAVAPAAPLPAGAPAPALALPSTEGTVIDLASYRGKRDVLLYFYEHAG